MYRIIIKERAMKQLLKIPKRFAVKIDELIQSLSHQPRPHGSIKISGYQNIYRVRYTDYRIVYSIEDSNLVVEIIQIGNRNDVYEILKR